MLECIRILWGLNVWISLLKYRFQGSIPRDLDLVMLSGAQESAF